MTPDEHIESLAEFFDHVASNARKQFKQGAGAYYDGHSDAFYAAAVHLRAAWSDMKTAMDADWTGDEDANP